MDSRVPERVATARVTSLAESFAIQRRVIGALLMREALTRYGRNNIGFLWLFVEPMIFTLGITALWYFVRAHTVSNLPIVAFAVTGYSSVLLWRNMANRSIGSIGPNRALMFHRNVRLIDIFVSRDLLELAGATTSFIVLAIAFTATGWMELPEDLLKVIIGFMLLAWFGFALSILLGCWAEQSEIVDKIWHPISYLLFPLSGAAFIVDALPASAREVILYFPMVHGVEYLREGYFGSLFTAHYDLGYLIGWNLMLTLLAAAKLRAVGRELVLE
jgi:ABC-type polysaccharide/polyol phosphate export permease